MPAITVDDTLVLPRIPRPDRAVSTPRPVAEVITAHRQTEGAGFTVRRPFPGELSMAEADPFLLLDHLGPQVNAPDSAEGRAVASASRLRDRELHPRRRDRPPRHQRRRRRDRRGRHPVDDRGRGHPPRRTADRADVPQRRPRPRRAAVGQPPPGAEDDATALPIDHTRRASAPHLRRRRRADPPHRRRHRRIHRAGRHPHPDHLRPRDPGARRRDRRAVESGVQRDGLRADRPRHRRTGAAARSRAANSSCSAPATISSWPPPTGRPSRSTCCCWAGCRSAHRSPTTARS